MADTSSDDELPLAQRPVGGFLLAAGCPKAVADSSDESDFPSWLQTGGACQKGNQVINLTDSDSDDAVLSPPKPEAPAVIATAAAAAVQPAGNRDVQQPSMQQMQENKPQTASIAALKSAAKQKTTPRRRALGAAVAAAGDEEARSQPQASQPPTQPPASQAAGAGDVAQKRVVGVGLAHVAVASQMPLVLPDKLPQMKMLVELESTPDLRHAACHLVPADDAHGVTDLSGDSGAIGRLVIVGTKEEPQMQVDLKGVLYNTTIVPCPVSIAIINMGHAEAKVECLFSEFVQLREDTRFSFVDTNQLGGMVGGDNDDDYYSIGVWDDAGAGEGGAKKKGRGKVPAAGKAKAVPRKRTAPRGKGGVKWGGAKLRAKPKAKAGKRK